MCLFSTHYIRESVDISPVNQFVFVFSIVSGVSEDFVQIADLSIKDTDEDEALAIKDLEAKQANPSTSSNPNNPLQEFLAVVQQSRYVSAKAAPPNTGQAREGASGSSSTHALDSTLVDKQIQDSVRGCKLGTSDRDSRMLQDARTARNTDHPQDYNERFDSRTSQSTNRADTRQSTVRRDTRQSTDRRDTRQSTDRGDTRDILSQQAQDSQVTSESSRRSRTHQENRAASLSDSNVPPSSKQKRVRKKVEIRKRFVSQLLIRGENVVLVSLISEDEES